MTHCVMCGGELEGLAYHVCPRKVGNYYTIRPQASPYRRTWQQLAIDGAKDVAEVILGVVVFLSLFIGVPLLLWLVAS